MSSRQAWLGFWVLGLIWGSSYLFIRIGVEQIPPFQLVFIRTAIAAVGLTVVVYARGKRLPSDWQDIKALLFLGIVNTVIPFALITWGETHIESGLASVLQGTTALFTLVLGHFVFVDERITLRKVIGLLIGFLGVITLASRSSGEVLSAADSNLHLLGQLAILGSSICYATGNNFSRKAMQKRLEPIVVSASAMIVASVITGVIAYAAPAMGGAAPISFADMTPRVLYAILTLGILNTFAAYLLYYPLINVLGASRTSMITYIILVVGLLLGALFLNEPVDIRLLIGALLIIASIAVVNLNLYTLFKNLSKSSAPSNFQ